MTLPNLIVAQVQHLQTLKAQEATRDGLQLVVIQQLLCQGGTQDREGHTMDAIGAKPVVGQVQELEAWFHVCEHIARGALSEVVMQHQAL